MVDVHAARPHPLGVFPTGNSLLDPGGTRNRVVGLGSLARLGDELVLTVLRALPPEACGRLACTSPVLHAFAGHEELWRDHCLRRLNAGLTVQWVAEGTWRAAYVGSATAVGTRRPAAGLRTAVRVYSDALYKSFVCAVRDLKSTWVSRETIARVDARGLTAAEFMQRFEKCSRPVVLEGAAAGWPAQSWSKETLSARFGTVPFAVGPCELPLRDFYEYAGRNLDEVPLFVFDRSFPGRAPGLLEDYEVPEVFRGRDLFDLLGEDRPDFRWIIIGNHRTGSRWHIDPNKTCAWNAVVRGRKKWMLLPPGCPPPGVRPSRDGADVTQPVSLVEWFSLFYEELRRCVEQNSAWDLQEGICGPGDVVFIPCGWWHCVLNLEDDTIAVTQNYVSETHLHSVRRFLREKATQVSGVHGKALLADRFDDALAKYRPELLAAPKEETPQAGALAAPGDRAFSFWEHLRSTGKSLAFSAPGEPTPPETAPEPAGAFRGTAVDGCQVEEEACGEAPPEKRPRLQEDSWLASLGTG